MLPSLDAASFHQLLKSFLDEDLGSGDITSEMMVPAAQRGRGELIAKADLVLAGAGLFAEVFKLLDPASNSEILCRDGDEITPGQIPVRIQASARALLAGERVALNLIQRLSGIATLTRKFVRAVEGTGAKILDTRKTSPGLRALEKAAVVAGGGANHRSTLSDMVLVKDNHLSAGAGFSGFVNAIQRLRQERPGLKIEVEAERLEQVRSFLEVEGIDVILLDNMEPTGPDRGEPWFMLNSATLRTR